MQSPSLVKAEEKGFFFFFFLQSTVCREDVSKKILDKDCIFHCTSVLAGASASCCHPLHHAALQK